MRITTRSHDQEESKLNSTINANSGDHTLRHDKTEKIHSIRIKKQLKFSERSYY